MIGLKLAFLVDMRKNKSDYVVKKTKREGQRPSLFNYFQT